MYGVCQIYVYTGSIFVARCNLRQPKKPNSHVHQSTLLIHCPFYNRTPLTSSPPVTLAASRSAVLICNPWSSQPWVPFLYSVFCSSRLGIGPVLPRRSRESNVSSSEALSPSSGYPSRSSVCVSSLKENVRYSVLDQPVPMRVKNNVSGRIPCNHSHFTYPGTGCCPPSLQ